MQRQISSDVVHDLLKSMVIPPRPAILVALEEARRQDAPDLQAIGQLIAEDVSLSASVLKTVNSPLMRRPKRISSVPKAVQLLGLDNLLNLVRGLVLRSALEESAVPSAYLDGFWSESHHVAMVAAYLASHIKGISADDAYTFGLFHGCGTVLMMMRYPDYLQTLHEGERMSRAAYLAMEDSRYQTSFNVVGYLLCRTWFLPEDVCLAVLNQHDYSLFEDEALDQANHRVLSLISLGSLAEHIVKMTTKQFEHVEWRQIEPLLLGFLGLEREEFEDLYDAVQLMLNDAA